MTIEDSRIIQLPKIADPRGNLSIIEQIKQIPGVTEIVWALHEKQPGEIWEKEEIQRVKDEFDKYGFGMAVVESVNVHDDIKTGSGKRDLYIENYKQCLPIEQAAVDNK